MFSRIAFVAALAIATSAWAQPCTSLWSTQFINEEVPYGLVRLYEADADGSGPLPRTFYATVNDGNTGTPRMRRWTGTGWANDVGNPQPAPNVMYLHDEDGPGPLQPVLFVGGLISSAGGIGLANVGKFNGTTWSNPGGGLGSLVASFQTFDEDGPGGNPPLLFAGGRFANAGIQRGLVARWDGVAWTAVGGGGEAFNNNLVNRFALFDPDGSGPQRELLIASGQYTRMGGIVCNNIAAWDGVAWSALGSGLNSPPSDIEVFDLDGDGPQLPSLLAVGSFTASGTTTLRGIARWTGTAWVAFTEGFATGQYDMQVFDEDAEGPMPARLFVSGPPTTSGATALSGVSVLNGDSWSPVGGSFLASLGSTIRYGPYFLFVRDPDAAGPAPARLWALGEFAALDTGARSYHGAEWNGSSWISLHRGFDYNIFTGYSYDPDGAGPASPELLIGGWFRSAPGGIPANGAAAFGGTQWRELGGGVRGAAPGDLSGAGQFIAFDPDGAGPAPERLVVSGGFTHVGTRLPGGTGEVAARGIAQWNGSAWSALGDGTQTTSGALEVFDPDGPSPLTPRLYVGGTFQSIGGVSAINIASWDGSSWASLSAGVEQAPYALKSFDADGPGTARALLWVGGSFTHVNGSTPTDGAARWSGTAWTPSTGLWQDVGDFEIFDPDGTGPGLPRLYASGSFQTGSGFAVLNGTAWSAVPGFVGNGAGSLTLFDDDGPGPNRESLLIYTAEGTTQLIKKWTGTQWSTLVTNVGPPIVAHDDDGPGPMPPALYVSSSPRVADMDSISYGGRYGQPLAPLITRQPFDAAARINRSAAFFAYGQGDGSITYRWRKNGNNLADNANISGATTGILRIARVGQSDAGAYDCVVSGPCFANTTRSVMLTIPCAADYDDGTGRGVPDGGVTLDDLLFYLDLFAAGSATADLDDGTATGSPDGGTGLEDLLYFLARFDAGC